MSLPALAPATSSFAISAAVLLSATKQAAHLLTRNPVVPVLENLLLEIEPVQARQSNVRSLRLSSSNLEHQFTSKALPVEAPSTLESTSICVPGKQLLHLLSNLPDQSISFSIEHEVGSHPYLHLQTELPLSLLPSGRGHASYTLGAEAGNDFPRQNILALPATTLHISGAVLLDGLAVTVPITGTDELRPAMTGVLLDVTAYKLRLVATCGHRLVLYTKEKQHAFQGMDRMCIIPRKAAELLLKLLDRRETVEVQLTQKHARFLMAQGELLVRLIDERYPDYENVIPVSSPNVLTVHRLELLAGLKRAAVLVNKTTHQIAFSLSKDGCELVADDRDFDTHGREVVSGSYQGEEMQIGMSCRFLQGFLAAMPCQNVRISMSTPSRAIVLQSADDETGLLCLLMPMMINNYI